MVKYSFLDESFTSLSRKLSNYTPEQRKRIVEKLISSGQLYSPLEYSQKMINGQKQRLAKIAKQNGRKLRILHSDNFEDFRILPSHNIKLIAKPVPEWDDSVNKVTTAAYRNSIRGKDTVVLPKINNKSNLLHGDTATHEADEYSTMFSLAKRLNLSPGEISYLTTLYNKTSPGKHNLGVLKRELKRRSKLNAVYGYNYSQRDINEINHNNVSIKILLKYLGSIKDSEKDLLRNKVTKSDSLKILKQQKETIENFIKRKYEISKMPEGLLKSIRKQKLDQDIANYNIHLDANRKPLKFNA